MNSHAPIFSQETVKYFINQFPSNYEEMHAKKESWPILKENLQRVLNIIEYLKSQSDSESFQLLASLAHNVGVFYTHVIADYSQSINFLTLAIESKKKISAVDEQSLALSHSQLADCAYRNNNFSLAIEQFNLAHDLYKKYEGNQNCDLMRAFVLHASGNAFYNLGAYNKAIEVFSEAKKIRKLYLPEDHIEFGYLEHDWADVLCELGRFEEAQTLYLSSLEKKKKFFQTENHTNIALLYQCQALMYIKTHQFQEAEINLKKAQSIYENHSQEFASEHQVDLFRNYFYSINLSLARGEWFDAEAKINSFLSKLNAVYKNGEHPYLYRLAHEKAELYHHQNNSDLAINALKESLIKFLPELKLASAIQLSDDKKIEVAQLISRYEIELFLHNQCQGFNECLSIITFALNLKQTVYEKMQKSANDSTLGALDCAFSYYDLGLLYYFDGFSSEAQDKKEIQFYNALCNLKKAKESYLIAGLSSTHPQNGAEICHINQ